MLKKFKGNSGWFLGFGTFLAGAVLGVNRSGWAVLLGAIIASVTGYIVVEKDLENLKAPLQSSLRELKKEVKELRSACQKSQ